MNQAFASMEGTGRIVRSHHPRPMATITQHAVETWFAMLAGEHDTCMRASRQALALAHETSVHIWSPQVLGNALASAVAAGDPETAARIRKDYVALSLERHPVDQSYRHCMLAWLHLSRGEHTAALRHQSTGLQLADEVGMPFLQALSHLGLAHVLQTRGDTHGATTYLSTALGIVERTRLGVLRFSCLLAAARFAFAREDLTAGMEHLRLALRHGCIHGCMNGYWWHSEWMGDLAERALRAKIEVPYVQDLVRRRALTTHSAPIDCPNWPWKARIYTLGRFQLIIDERVQRFNGKGQRRPLELLQALIAYGGREVPEQRLCDALWPDFDSDKAYVNLKMTLTRLRELLGDANLVVLSHGCLTLDAHRCWVDACDFERRLSRADAALKAGDRRAAWQALESALTLYRGPFLQSDNTGPWCLQPRERIRARLLRSVGGVGEALLAANDDEAALDCFGRGLEADPNAEVFYRGIIRCHMKLGRKAEAVDTYERCCRILGVDGRVPSAQTKALVWAS
jgi:DNA-binding SARP family transcriptional activator